ncbi:tetrahydromethanopterin S-methyltransferase, subunit B [Candidatus Methanoperedens nitroreducens]|uniref:Tetrahydromethanopterin S-methyltransferase subunit B n=2 Tax=Candidatus Methanoperedens nitratireducens TaxID=1392998 RepID=A0A062V9P2_9EURY|nr:tetrahydromethanopterin S-methyltransferase, subunit B [Candidatus Methanoperedens nitroreducens]
MYAIIDEDVPAAIDPYSGTVAEMASEKVAVNLAPVMDKIDRLEDIANDLFRSLDPMTAPLVSYPNREGIYLNLGRFTNFIYGFMAGLLIAIFIILALGVNL